MKIKNISSLMFSFFSLFPFAQNINLLVGTYTQPCNSEGIYSYIFNQNTAEYYLVDNTNNLKNPGFLTWTANHKYIYSVSEDGTSSLISAFKFEKKTGKLELINQQSTQGIDPCHIITDDKNIFIANYTSGSLSVYEINSDGSVGKLVQNIQHSGKGINEKRQEKAHVHQVILSPDKKFLLANDLGEDKLYVYNYNSENSSLPLSEFSVEKLKSGAGPRHLVFSPDGKFIYQTRELDGFISVYGFKEGKITFLSEISLLPPNVTDNFRVADIHVSPEGKFVYATNRDGKTNNISVFKTSSTGKLLLIQQIKTLGENPRNFQLTPNGKYLLVGNQDSNEIVIFERNKKTGKLSDSGKRIKQCAPVFIGFME